VFLPGFGAMVGIEFLVVQRKKFTYKILFQVRKF